jgi:hypothetical protein
MNQPTNEAVRSIVQRAVLGAYASEKSLFVEQAHERSMMFHIGRLLAHELSDWDKRWSVDVEYNRKHAQATIAKALQLGDRSPRVFPDLIVHDRTSSGANSNLLVVEAKRSSTPRSRRADYQKLRAFRSQLKFQNVVFLELRSAQAYCKWFDDETKEQDDLDPIN